MHQGHDRSASIPDPRHLPAGLRKVDAVNLDSKQRSRVENEFSDNFPQASAKNMQPRGFEGRPACANSHASETFQHSQLIRPRVSAERSAWYHGVAVVVGLEDGELITERPDATPNAAVELRESLPDGTEFKAVWSHLRQSEVAKLVTVHFFDRG
jgi:hypothetical protein